MISLSCSTHKNVSKSHLTLNDLNELHHEAKNMHADVLALAEYQRANNLRKKAIIANTRGSKNNKKLIRQAMKAYIEAENKALSASFTPQDILVARDYLISGKYKKNEELSKRIKTLDLELYDETDMFHRPLSEERTEYYYNQYHMLEFAALEENLKLIESKLSNKNISSDLRERHSQLARKYQEAITMAEASANNPWSIMVNLHRTLLSSSLLLEVLDGAEMEEEINKNETKLSE
tara:strand:+ start:9598 stop:10305 length:708 start_codon:yes stop_codon:yes gene_type:complete